MTVWVVVSLLVIAVLIAGATVCRHQHPVRVLIAVDKVERWHWRCDCGKTWLINTERGTRPVDRDEFGQPRKYNQTKAPASAARARSAEAKKAKIESARMPVPVKAKNTVSIAERRKA